MYNTNLQSFQDMTEEEIKNMSKEEFDAIPPEEKKSCYDCGWLTAAISWWCSNKKAIKYRGTSIPGVIKCKFWKPENETTNKVA